MNKLRLVVWLGRPGFVVLLGMYLNAPALAQLGGSRATNGANSPYANSDGPTVFKGQTYYPYGSNNDYGGFGEGLPIFRFGRSGARFGAVSTGNVAAVPPTRVIAPYLTNLVYEPGDGYRYPLYYNPANASYFYYPLAR